MAGVQGVYLQYVGVSAAAGLATLVFWRTENMMLLRHLMTTEGCLYLMRDPTAPRFPFFNILLTCLFAYGSLINAAVATMLRTESGMHLLGKDRHNGQIPLWSYLVWFPFHVPSMLVTAYQVRTATYLADEGGKKSRKPVDVANEILPGWWIGGCYANLLDKDWAGIIDLTVEFPERSFDRTKLYLSLPTWDGVTPTSAHLEEAANFALKAHKKDGDVLVHCSSGRGRSTAIMCACLVKVGLYRTWEEAYELGIRPKRPVCRLNKRMMQTLAQWQKLYGERAGPKGKRYSVSRLSFSSLDHSTRASIKNGK